MSYNAIESTLTKKMLSIPALNQLVGDRIYPGDLPQGCRYPAIAFHYEDGGSDNLLSGDTSGLAWAIFDVGAIAETRGEVNAILDLVRINLVGKRGDINSDGKCRVEGISLDGRGKVLSDLSRGVFEGSIDLHVQWHEEASDGI